MHRYVDLCVMLNGSIKRFTSCDTSGMRITWCVQVDGFLSVSEQIIGWFDV